MGTIAVNGLRILDLYKISIFKKKNGIVSFLFV